MRALIQRVDFASVNVGSKVTGQIEKGLLAFVGFSQSDNLNTLRWMFNKIIRLRIFEDSQKKMNLSLLDVKGALLLVSQFTLYGDCRKGNRPNFIQAAPPQQAQHLYKEFAELARKDFPYHVEEGVFGERMKVHLQNDGPVTFWLEKETGQ